VRDFLIDTQTIRYWYDPVCPQYETVVANIESLQKQVESSENKPRLIVSVITLGEIEFGHRVNPSADPNVQTEYLKFVGERFPVHLEVTEDAVTAYGGVADTGE
jgi:hypothetical protein